MTEQSSSPWARALDRLVSTDRLRCPGCAGASFTRSSEALTCDDCDTTAPISGGVPDFFNSYASVLADASTFDSTDPFIDELCDMLALEPTAHTRDRLAIAVARTALQTDRRALTAEISDLRGRFVPAQLDHPATPTDANEQATARVVRHYLPDAVAVGANSTANVRLENTGTTWWSSRTAAPMRLSARFVGRSRTTVPEFTDVPIDVEPGRAITLPARIRAPRVPGRYVLQVGLVVGEQDVPGSVATRRVVVGARGVQPTHRRVVVHNEEQLDYAADHVAAVRIADTALDAFVPSGDRWVLEVGGGVHPQSASHPRTNLVNLDISSPLLELGTIVDEQHGREIAHLCADAFAPPLAPGSFDAVTMYATLHHFAEPEQLLRRLKRLVRPGGFVAVMCEPVSDTLAHPDTVTDLLKGINEQAFTIEEYLDIFSMAELVPSSVQVDAGSLKAILAV